MKDYSKPQTFDINDVSESYSPISFLIEFCDMNNGNFTKIYYDDGSLHDMVAPLYKVRVKVSELGIVLNNLNITPYRISTLQAIDNIDKALLNDFLIDTSHIVVGEHLECSKNIYTKVVDFVLQEVKKIPVENIEIIP